MGMAGGAYQGDMERARLRMQAAQVANQRAAQDARQRQEQSLLAERKRQADMEAARVDRALDIREDALTAAVSGRPQGQDTTLGDGATIIDQRANDERLAALHLQDGMLGQFREVCDAEERRTEARKAQGQATMASLMKLARNNGGVAPMSALKLAARKFGFDGQTQAIGAAGYTANGDWFVDFITRNAQGQIVRNTETMPLVEQGAVYYSQAGIFDDNDRAAWRKSMHGAKYTDEQINTFAGMNATHLQNLDADGLARLEAGLVDPSGMGGDWKRQLAERKQAFKELKFAFKQKNALDPAIEYALKNFSHFNRPHIATTEDVAKGVAQNVGAYYIPTDQQKFDEALSFYRKNADRQAVHTPLTGTPTEGMTVNGSAIPVSASPTAHTIDELDDDENELDDDENELDDDENEDKEATPQTVATHPRRPRNQFGGNLSFDGLKLATFTNGRGKVTHFGVTDSVAVDDGRGSFVVIPTIVNGEKLTDADALKHYKDTGEFWGLAGTKEEGDFIARTVNAQANSINTQTWHDYIFNHWDEMAEEVQNDPAFAKEHERRTIRTHFGKWIKGEGGE